MKQIIAKYYGGSRRKAEEHYQSALKVMAPKPYVDVAGIASMIEFIAESDPLVAKVKPEMVINSRSSRNSTTADFSISRRNADAAD